MTESDRLDRETVEALWTAHAHDLHQLARGVLRDRERADEALQRAFLTVLERGHTARDETRRGWLFRVTYNHALELKREDRGKQRALEALEARTRDEDHAPPAADAAILRERRAATRAAIDGLPPAQREIVELRLRGEKTFRDIADALGIPLSTALTRMRLATEKLRAALARDEEEEPNHG